MDLHSLLKSSTRGMSSAVPEPKMKSLTLAHVFIRIEGKGQYTFKDGKVYIGEFKDGQYYFVFID